MPTMPSPMDGLLSFQQALNDGMPVNKLDADYIERYDENSDGKRYSYAKVVTGKVLALATFGQEQPINHVDCYSVNYSVNEKYRGRGLAVEVVNRGIKELKKHFSQSKTRSFYVDAIIDETNVYSINIAKKLFPGSGQKMLDFNSGVSSLYFQRLVILEIP